MALTQQIPFQTVIECHEQKYKPTESRFSRSSMRAWGAEYPKTAQKVGNRAYWVESWQRASDKQRSYAAKVINLDTGSIETVELEGVSPMMGDTSKTKVTKAFATFLHRLKAGNKRTVSFTGRKIGSIGICFKIEVQAQTDGLNPDEIGLLLHNLGYEHISDVQVR